MKPPKHPLATASAPKDGIGFGSTYQRASPEAEEEAKKSAETAKMNDILKKFERTARREEGMLNRRARMRKAIDEYTRRHKTSAMTKEEEDELYNGGRKRKTRRRRLTKKRRV